MAMQSRLKKVICGTVPAIWVAGAGANPVAADEVQSIIAHTVQQIGSPLPAPTTPPQPHPDFIIEAVVGVRR